MASTTVSQRPRALSSAIAPSPLLRLPAELLFDILELCFLQCKPTVLATISQVIASFVESILYRSVVLDSGDSVSSFHRAVTMKSPYFLVTNVKNLAFTWVPFPNSRACKQIWDIIVACTGVKTLSLPPGYHPLSLASIVHTRGSALAELVLASYDEVDYMGRCTSLQYIPEIHSTNSPLVPSSLTHLRVCEPSIAWCPPSSMLESLGELPHLSHLQLSRRAYANEDNDVTFMDDVSDILTLRPQLQKFVVLIFPCLWAEGDNVQQSHIWIQLSKIAEEDTRLVLRQGDYGGWRDDCRTTFSSPIRPSGFWRALEAAKD